MYKGIPVLCSLQNQVSSKMTTECLTSMRQSIPIFIRIKVLFQQNFTTVEYCIIKALLLKVTDTGEENVTLTKACPLVRCCIMTNTGSLSASVTPSSICNIIKDRCVIIQTAANVKLTFSKKKKKKKKKLLFWFILLF